MKRKNTLLKKIDHPVFISCISAADRLAWHNSVQQSDAEKADPFLY